MENLKIKEVEGFCGNYLIREDGVLFRKKDMFKLTPRSKRKDYLYYELSEKGKPKHRSVHWLVASHFCDGYIDGLQINHKDGNKTNNHYSNLEWVTMEENLVHAYQNSLIHLAKLSKQEVESLLTEADLFIESQALKYDVGKSTIKYVLHKPGLIYRKFK